jgi:hypothetical protein
MNKHYFLSCRKQYDISGKSSKLYTQNNGKYLSLLQLLVEFQTVMQITLASFLKAIVIVENISWTYWINGGKSSLKNNFMRPNCQIFFIIADCRPDSSRLEQLSVTIRYVDVTNENDNGEICERFLGLSL